MKKPNMVRFATLAFVALAFATYAYAATAPAVDLGSTEDFSVIAGSTITNTGSTVLSGDLGLSPGTAVTGFPPGTVNGSQHIADAEAGEAKDDLVDAYNDALGRTPATSIGTEMGGSTILPGVYTSGTLAITGTLTLDAQGDPSAVFIFKAGSTLVTAASSNVVLAGGAQACNVFWQVGSSATLGTNSNLSGTILALTSVTLTTGADVEGRVFARNGAVTLDSNNITEAECDTAPVVAVETEAETEAEVIVDAEDSTEATTTPVVVTVQSTTSALVTPSFPNTGSRPMHVNVVLLLAMLAMSSGIILLSTKIKA